jgi:hypothetical protein
VSLPTRNDADPVNRSETACSGLPFVRRGLHDVQVIDHSPNGDSPRGAPEAKNRPRFEDFFVSDGGRLFGALFVVTAT